VDIIYLDGSKQSMSCIDTHVDLCSLIMISLKIQGLDNRVFRETIFFFAITKTKYLVHVIVDT